MSLSNRHKAKPKQLSTISLNDWSQISKNNNDGLIIVQDEVESAFKFYDTEQKGLISAHNLKDQLLKFNESIAAQQIKTLLQEKDGLSLEEMKNLVRSAPSNFDPVAEAFATFDPKLTGYIDTTILKRIYRSLGLGDLNEEELNILVEYADKDGDGRISLEDFRGLYCPPL